ncbi:hypothetical protein IAU59_003079 [Kwoniella sp. CBS 9459]
MADDIQSWISKAIVDHDTRHGANRSIPLEGRYAQLVEFSSYRTPLDPNAEIRGIASDRTHHVRVKFDVEATDEFEEPQASLPSESLTSHLRSIFHLQSCIIHLEQPISSVKKKPYNRQPHPSPYPDLPRVLLEVKKWTVVGGSKDDPVYYDKTAELGRGSAEGEGKLQEVLRKWWFGESNSDPSQNQPSSMETPSRNSSSKPKPLISSPVSPSHTIPQQKLQILPTQPQATSITALGPHSAAAAPVPAPIKVDSEQSMNMIRNFLDPYLNSTGGKKRTVPDWLFETPEEVERMLNDISIFALDLATSSQLRRRYSSTSQYSPIPMLSDKKGKGRAIVPLTEDYMQDIGMESSDLFNPNGGIAPIFEDNFDQTASMASTSRLLPAVHTIPPVARTRTFVNPLPPDPTKSVEKPRSEDEESDDGIPIRPVGGNLKRRNDMFDPLAMPSSSPAPLEDVDMDEEDQDGTNVMKQDHIGDNGDGNNVQVDKVIEEDVFGTAQRKGRDGNAETDEDDLSDYERRKRRAKRSKKAATSDGTELPPRLRKEETNSHVKRRSVSVAVQTDQVVDVVSGPAGSTITQSVRTGAHILVDDSDQSLPHPSQSQHVSDESVDKDRTKPAPNMTYSEKREQPVLGPNTSQSQASPVSMPNRTQSDRGHDADISGSLEESIHNGRKPADQPDIQAVPQVRATPSPDLSKLRRTRYRSIDGPDQPDDDTRVTKKPKIELATPLAINRNGITSISTPQAQHTPASAQSSGRSTRKSFLQSIRFFRSTPASPATPASPTARPGEAAASSLSHGDDSATGGIEPDSPEKRAGDGDDGNEDKSPGFFARLGKWAVDMPHYDQSDNGSDDDDEDTEIHVEEEDEGLPRTEAESEGKVERESKTEHAKEIKAEEEEEDVEIKRESLEPAIEGPRKRTVVRIFEAIYISDSDLDDICTDNEADAADDDDGVDDDHGDGFWGDAVGTDSNANRSTTDVSAKQAKVSADDQKDGADEEKHGGIFDSHRKENPNLDQRIKSQSPIKQHPSINRQNHQELRSSPPIPPHSDELPESHNRPTPMPKHPRARSFTPATMSTFSSPIRSTQKPSLVHDEPSQPAPLIEELGGRARKLGGYELDLKIDGLSEKFVQRALDAALTARKGKKSQK